MDFAQTQEQQMIQDMAKDFAENEIKPYVEEDEKNQHWRREIFEKMAELGFFGFCINEKYGGNGMGFLEGTLAIEQVAKIHTSWRMAFNMQSWTFGRALRPVLTPTSGASREWAPRRR